MILIPSTWYETTGIAILVSIVAILSVVTLIEWIRWDLSIATTRKSAPKDREIISYYDLPVGAAGRDFSAVNYRQRVTIPKDSLMFYSRSITKIQMDHIRKCASIRGAKLKISVDRWKNEYSLWFEK